MEIIFAYDKIQFFYIAVAKPDRNGLYIACGVILLFLVAGFFIVRKLRQNLTDNRKNSDFNGFGLTFEQIDDMREAGHISDEEHSAMRKALSEQISRKEKLTVSGPEVDIIKEQDNTESQIVELSADDEEEC